MGRPSTRRVDAIMFSARFGESEAEFDARVDGLSRLSDEELAAMGITARAKTKAPKLTKLTTPRIRSLAGLSPRLGR